MDDGEKIDVVFRVPAPEVDSVLQTLAEDDSLRPQAFQSAGALGGGDLVTILVAASATAFPILAKVMIELDKNRRASIEIDGIKAKNISRETAEKILLARLSQKSAVKKRAR